MTTIDLQGLATWLGVVLAVAITLAAYRMIKGPSLADRFIALDMLTAVVVALAALTTLATRRGAFLEIALGVGLINFASTCAYAAFLGRTRGTR